MLLDYIVLAALLVASFTDIRRREIPLFLFPFSVFIVALYMWYKDISFSGHIIIMLFMFTILMIYSFFIPFGGGDIIMLTSLAFIIGINEICSYLTCLLLVSSAFYPFYLFIQVILMKKKMKEVIRNEIPLAPITTVSYIIFLFFK